MKYLDPKDDIRFKEGLYWPGSTKPKKMIQASKVLERIVLIAAITFAGIAVSSYMINQALSEELKTEKAKTATNASEARMWLRQLVTCLNGGTLYDKASNTAFFCAKPIEVKL